MTRTTRPARVARHRRHAVSARLTGILPGLDHDEVEMHESWVRGGGKPEIHSFCAVLYRDDGVWMLRREAPPGTSDASHILYLIDSLVQLLDAPESAHPHLRSLCEAGEIEQALELARSLTCPQPMDKPMNNSPCEYPQTYSHPVKNLWTTPVDNLLTTYGQLRPDRWDCPAD